MIIRDKWIIKFHCNITCNISRSKISVRSICLSVTMNISSYISSIIVSRFIKLRVGSNKITHCIQNCCFSGTIYTSKKSRTPKLYYFVLETGPVYKEKSFCSFSIILHYFSSPISIPKSKGSISESVESKSSGSSIAVISSSLPFILFSASFTKETNSLSFNANCNEG